MKANEQQKWNYVPTAGEIEYRPIYVVNSALKLAMELTVLTFNGGSGSAGLLIPDAWTETVFRARTMCVAAIQPHHHWLVVDLINGDKTAYIG